MLDHGNDNAPLLPRMEQRLAAAALGAVYGKGGVWRGAGGSH